MSVSVTALDQTRRMFLGQHAGNVGLLALASMLNAQRPSLGRFWDPVNDRRPGFDLERRPSSACSNGGPSRWICSIRNRSLRSGMASRIGRWMLETHFDKQKGNVLGSPYRLGRYGQSGIGKCVNSCHTPDQLPMK